MKFIMNIGKQSADLANKPFLLRWLYPFILVGIPAGFGLLTAFGRHNYGLAVVFLIFILVAYSYWRGAISASRAYLKHDDDHKNRD